jgi:hypothetical protein
MALDCLVADHQILADVAIGTALRDQRQNLEFPVPPSLASSIL